MKVAIIGLGNIGRKVARNLSIGGQPVIVADRTATKAESLAVELGGATKALPIEQVIRTADVIVLAVYLDAIKDLIRNYHASLAGKVVVDPSNPIAPDGKGGFTKIIPHDQSSGQMIATMLPEGAELVKAFGTISADSLASAVNRLPDRAVLFYATDYKEAGRVAATLITASGFSPVSVGGINQSIRIEVGGDLHEYGKLGRLVSATEAAALL